MNDTDQIAASTAKWKTTAGEDGDCAVFTKQGNKLVGVAATVAQAKSFVREHNATLQSADTKAAHELLDKLGISRGEDGEVYTLNQRILLGLRPQSADTKLGVQPIARDTLAAMRKDK